MFLKHESFNAAWIDQQDDHNMSKIGLVRDTMQLVSTSSTTCSCVYKPLNSIINFWSYYWHY